MDNNTLNQLMVEYLHEFNNLENNNKIQFYHINSELLLNQNSIYNIYWNKFSQILTNLDPEIIVKYCNKFKIQSPTIIFEDIMKFYKLFMKKQNIILPSNFNIKQSTLEQKIHFLTYTFVVEIFVNNYVDRMNHHILN